MIKKLCVFEKTNNINIQLKRKVMSTFKILNRLRQIDQLIKLKATGNPKEFAKKIGVSKRMIFHYLNDLKDLGAEIYFDKGRSSYCYARSFNL